MSENTRILSLPLIQGGQAQKHITHNEALRRLDALVQPVALDMDLTAPPALPDEGDRHIIAPGPTGEWAGQGGAIAVREGQAWAFVTPAEGWQVYVIALGAVATFDGTTWQQTAGGQTLGLNATADETNRLTVSAEATLLTHDGAGHQVKVNKAVEGDTNSLLFQTGFSGRAEMGCAGSDAFSVKVSDDGGIWRDAIVADPATGMVKFPSGARTRQQVHFGGRWNMETTDTWVTFWLNLGMASGLHAQASGTGDEPDLVWQAAGIYVAAGTTLLGLSGILRSPTPEMTGYDLKVYFQTNGGDDAWIGNNRTTRTLLHDTSAEPISAAWRSCAADFTPFQAPKDGFVCVYFRPTGTVTTMQSIVSALALDMIA